MKKIVTIVGARPQFIKLAVVSKVLRKYFDEVIVHTGQHYDYNMSEVFFEEMKIPKPDYNLSISGGTHGDMTGRMLIEIEKVLMNENPDGVLVYGDTNSTMAGALAAVKLHVPVFHVEAGSRLGTLDNPEEINRIVTDHVSTELFCCTESAMSFIKKEGKTDNIHLSGDPMYDAFVEYSKQVGDTTPERIIGPDCKEEKLPKHFYYLTCHREENTKDEKVLTEILDAMNELEYNCIYPVHPRNKETAKKIVEKNSFRNIILCAPVGYLMSVYLVNHAEKIVTDSGGLQREAYFAKKQCVTVFDYVVWPETMTCNRNQLSKPNRNEILEKLSTSVDFNDYDYPFGDGHSADKIVDVVRRDLYE